MHRSPSRGVVARLTSLLSHRRTRSASAPPAAREARGGAGSRAANGRVRWIAVVTTAAVLAGGAVAYSATHKSVTLDVDGEITQVSTFAGSVEGVLKEADVTVGPRDLVAPAADAPLRSGDEVVVRHARQIDLLVDDVEQTVWTTALTAHEALQDFTNRGEDVFLVASRSIGDGRPALVLDLGLELTPGAPVEVVVDGATHELANGALGVAEALIGLGVELGPLDRVTVREATDAAPVGIVVERIEVTTEVSTKEVEFDSVTKNDPNRYTGQRVVVTAGKPGERTLKHRVTLVDGEEVERELISDEVTTEPVTEVIHVGTKKRPAPQPATAGGSGGGSSPTKAKGSTASLNWAALAACESGGNPSIVSRNGLYHGLYQFSVPTWRSVGGSGLPSQASPAEQTKRAMMLYERSGAGQWPTCGPRLFS